MNNIDDRFYIDLVNLLHDVYCSNGDEYVRNLLMKHYEVRKVLVLHILESEIFNGNSDN